MSQQPQVETFLEWNQPRQTLAQGATHLLLVQGDIIYHPSVEAAVSERDAYCSPERPTSYEIWHDIKGGESFNRSFW